MTLTKAIDIMIAQTERAMQVNANNRDLALADGDFAYYERCKNFSKRLATLHSKLIVVRGEITNLGIYGCTAVFTELNGDD